MITDEFELQERIEELRKQTLPMLWSSSSLSESSTLVDQLDRLLREIKNSKDYETRRKAADVIEKHVDFDVDCDPTVTVTF